MTHQRPTGSWLILTFRNGADVRDPSDIEIADAVAEVYRDASDIEHNGTWLRYGLSDDGPMFVLDARTFREITFEEYADADFNVLISEKKMEQVAQSEVVRLFQMLHRGDLESLSHELWTNVVLPKPA